MWCRPVVLCSFSVLAAGVLHAAPVPPREALRTGGGQTAVLVAVLVLGGVVAALERRRMARARARQADLERTVEQAMRDLAAANRDLAAKNGALEQANRALEQANEVKTEFLSVAAHDLKNPLGVVLGLSELMFDQVEDLEPREPAQARMLRERLTLVRDSADHMARLVGDLLQTAALEGEVHLAREAVAIDALAVWLVEAHSVPARRKDITIWLLCDEPAHVDGDPDRLREILSNLIGNAVKFSPPGRRVWVVLSRSEDHRHVRIAVRDEGPGISLRDKARLFGRFERLTARPTGGESSTGLGLSIVKRLVDLHGGQIRVESELGAGATFIVELPAAEPATSPSPDEPPASEPVNVEAMAS